MRVCSHCFSENADSALFCSACGTALVERPQREERKLVTVVFVDLVGFTAVSERADPEDVRGVQRPFFALVREELERYGGTVEKFIGDAVMAVFGAPVAHEDDAERAVRAAIAVRDALAAKSTAARIGVNSGEALVSLDARPEAGESFVAGDVVNTAARLQAGAEPGTALVGQSTWRATRDVIEFREVAAVAAKGKADTLHAWVALSPRARLGIDVLQLGGVPLVGRERERALLMDTLGRVRSEREPQLATLVGVPGIGKSRLTYEVLRAVHDDPELITWRQGRCLAYGGLPFAPVAELVKAHAGIFDTDSAATAEVKLREVVATLAIEDSDFVLSHLLALVGSAEPPVGERTLAEAAWLSFFVALAENRPTVIVFEDVHWAAEELLSFIEELVDGIRGVPLFVLCTARPELLERRRAWGGGKVNALTLSLSPLSDAETGELVGGLLDEILAPETQELLLQQAGGNPLYAEQFVRMMLEGGSDVPDTVQAIIAARIDGLAPAQKEVLQRAAVVGKVFWSGIAGGGEEELRALERKDFIRRERRSSVVGESEYAFRHVLARDVAYGQIPRSRRWQLHVETARWLNGLSDRADRIEMVAHHYLEALQLARVTQEETPELREEARFPLRDAGLKAFEEAGASAAEPLLATALEIWPEEDSDWAWMLDRHSAARQTLAPPQLRDDELLPRRRALERLIELGDLARAARVAVALSSFEHVAGDAEAAAQHRAQALDFAERSGDRLARLSILRNAASTAQMVGDSETALRYAHEALALARELHRPREEGSALGWIAQAKSVLGDPTAGADMDEALRILHEARAPEQAFVETNLAVSLVEVVGDVWRGNALHRALLPRVRRTRDGLQETAILIQLAGAGWWTGEWDEAVKLSRELLSEPQADTKYSEAFLRATLARIAAARGDRAEAELQARAAVARGRSIDDAQILDPALAVAARVLRDEEAAVELSGKLLARGAPAHYCLVDLAFATIELGRPKLLLDVLDAHPHPSHWDTGACAVAELRWTDAISAFDEIGALSEAAYARLAAGDRAGAAAFFEPRGASGALAST